MTLLALALTLPAFASAPQSPPASSTSLSGIPRDEALPADVRIETVLEGMHMPIAMAFDPAGRLFYTEKDGNVRLFANGVLQPDPVITFKVNSAGERGLLGIALDPDFASNHFIYVYHTCDQDGGCPALQNQVVRFTENNGTGSDPITIFTSPQDAPNHNGGNIHFGPDKMLYVSIGENADPPNSQDLTATQGKMHRIRPDGSIPDDNPTFNVPGALPSVYAYGLRNSFDFAFDPVVPGRIFASENGPGCDDEMNRIEAGNNYGWRPDYPCEDNSEAGPDPTYNSINPLWYIRSADCCVAPTGITVYTGNSIPEWHNQIFMAVYNSGQLYRFVPNEDRTLVTSVTSLHGVTANLDVETGPDGALWYMDGGGDNDGALRRLVGTGSAQPTPAPTTAPVSTPMPAPTIPGTGSVTFPETGQTVSGIFLDYWNQHGGLAQQGFPISKVFTETSDLDGKRYLVQYFERAVFEYHPEQTDPQYQVLLSQLGTFRYSQKYPDGAPDQQPNSSDGSVLFAETGHRAGGRFLQYWQEHGGLAQQGYPISDEFTEISDLNGQPYTVQYFERAVFEYHPENAGTAYDVLLSQLGTFRYKEKYPIGGQ
jgi:glucose/arabinose dehydrogenase